MPNPHVGSSITGCSSPTIGADKDTFTGVIDTLAQVIDDHDHTTTKGKPIGTNALSDGAVTTAKMADGAVTAAKAADGIVSTTAKLADGIVSFIKRIARSVTASTATAGQVALSSSCGQFDTTSTSFVDVTNLSVTLTSLGGICKIGLVSDGDATSGHLSLIHTTSSQFAQVDWQILDGATVVANGSLASFVGNATQNNCYFPISAIQSEVVLAPGAHTLKLQIRHQGSGTISDTSGVYYSKLQAYEV